ncbi:hypothetical protein ACV35H_33725, partial [Pseudomonas aeruginosa]
LTSDFCLIEQPRKTFAYGFHRYIKRCSGEINQLDVKSTQRKNLTNTTPHDTGHQYPKFLHFHVAPYKQQ